MMEKRNKIIMTIFVVLVILVGIIAVYFGITKKQVREDNNELMAQLESANASLKEVNEKNSELESKLEKSSEKIETVKDVVKEDEETKTDSASIKSAIISNENCFNPTTAEYRNYKINNIEVTTNKYCKMEEDSAKIMIGEYDSSSNSTKYQERKVENINQKIVYAGKYAYRDDDAAIFFVLEDGSVYYLGIVEGIEKGHFEATKIQGVSNVRYIIEGRDGHSRTPLLVTAEGKFYDARQAIYNP